MNRVIAIGNLGGDVELKYSKGGSAVANFSLACNETWIDKEGNKQSRTEWMKIVVWGKKAETCHKYLGKGRKVAVEGKLQTDEWTDKDGNKRYTTKVVAHNVEFLSSAGESEQQPMRHPKPQQQERFDQSFSDDDIPF